MTVNGSITTTTYAAGGLEEISSNGVSTTLTKYFTAANGLPTAERVGTNGPLSYLASDGQGTVSEALDSAGNVSFAQLYTPYGTARYSSGSSPTTLGYTGQRADSATGLDYYHARYYDPVAGKFTSADKVADGLNRYGYVRGNPTTATDPTGHRLYIGGGEGSVSTCWIPNSCPPTRPTCTFAPLCDHSNSGSTNNGGTSDGGTNDGGRCNSVSSCNANQGCHSISQCSGIQHPGIGHPCGDDKACFLGSEPNGLFHYLPHGAGTDAASLILNGRSGIEWFLSIFDQFKQNVDGAFSDLINAATDVMGAIGALSAVMGGAAGLAGGPPGLVAGAAAGITVGGAVDGIILGATIANYQSQQAAFDAMAGNFVQQLRDLEAQLTDASNVQIVVTVGPIASSSDDSAWTTQQLHIADIFVGV